MQADEKSAVERKAFRLMGGRLFRYDKKQKAYLKYNLRME